MLTLLCTLLHYEKLRCTLLRYEKLRCTLLHYEKLRCTLLHYEQLRCTLLHYEKLRCTLLHYEKLCCTHARAHHIRAAVSQHWARLIQSALRPGPFPCRPPYLVCAGFNQLLHQLRAGLHWGRHCVVWPPVCVRPCIRIAPVAEQQQHGQLTVCCVQPWLTPLCLLLLQQKQFTQLLLLKLPLSLSPRIKTP